MENNNKGNETISEKKIILSIKEIIVSIIFLVSVGTSIGGYISVIKQVDKISETLSIMSKDINDIKIQNAITITKIELLLNNKKR